MTFNRKTVAIIALVPAMKVGAVRMKPTSRSNTASTATNSMKGVSFNLNTDLKQQTVDQKECVVEKALGMISADFMLCDCEEAQNTIRDKLNHMYESCGSVEKSVTKLLERYHDQLMIEEIIELDADQDKEELEELERKDLAARLRELSRLKQLKGELMKLWDRALTEEHRDLQNKFLRGGVVCHEDIETMASVEDAKDLLENMEWEMMCDLLPELEEVLEDPKENYTKEDLVALYKEEYGPLY